MSEWVEQHLNSGRNIDVDDYDSLEKILWNLIKKWLLDKSLPENDKLFAAINTALEQDWYNRIERSSLTDDQERHIREAYFKACRKDTNWTLLDTLTENGGN